MMKLVRLLDHGFVRLVDHMGDDLAVVRAARVSYDAAWRAGSDKGGDARLIRYLLRHRHTSPFEAVEFCFEIKAPIFVLRQWTRHRTWNYASVNELSARYRQMPEEYYVPEPALVGRQSKDSKQGRDLDVVADAEIPAMIDDACARAFATYHDLLLRGCPRELARVVLPLATYTHLFAKVDLNNLLHFCELRLSAQYEIRVYAEAVCELIAPIVPVTMAAWEELQAAA